MGSLEGVAGNGAKRTERINKEREGPPCHPQSKGRSRISLTLPAGGPPFSLTRGVPSLSRIIQFIHSERSFNYCTVTAAVTPAASIFFLAKNSSHHLSTYIGHLHSIRHIHACYHNEKSIFQGFVHPSFPTMQAKAAPPFLPPILLSEKTRRRVFRSVMGDLSPRSGREKRSSPPPPTFLRPSPPPSHLATFCPCLLYLPRSSRKGGKLNLTAHGRRRRSGFKGLRFHSFSPASLLRHEKSLRIGEDFEAPSPFYFLSHTPSREERVRESSIEGLMFAEGRKEGEKDDFLCGN